MANAPHGTLDYEFSVTLPMDADEMNLRRSPQGLDCTRCSSEEGAFRRGGETARNCLVREAALRFGTHLERWIFAVGG
jgi:hypothetical protein